MMENLENSLPEQQFTPNGPENITPPQADMSFLKKLKTKWPIVLGALGSIALFAVIIYAAYSYSKRGRELQPTPTPIAQLTPTVTVTPIITSISTPETTNITPTVSSKGKIAFVRDGDIWIINTYGSDEERVINLPDEQLEPTARVNYPLGVQGTLFWSPDGQKIAFKTWLRDIYDKFKQGKPFGGPHYGSLKIVDINTGEILTTNEITIELLSELAWSPDSKQIAYVGAAKDGLGKSTVNIYSTTKQIITEIANDSISLAYDTGYPQGFWGIQWSKSGELIFYGRKDGSLISINPISREISVIVNSGSAVKAPSEFNLSPDGTKIMYIATDGLWMVNTVSGNHQKIYQAVANKAISSLVLSPNGKEILFHVQQTPTAGSGIGELWLIDVSGNDARQIIPQGTQASFSPDGTKVAYQYKYYGDYYGITCEGTAAEPCTGMQLGIAVYDIATGKDIQLTGTKSRVSDSYPAWSPL